jgi:hypothetical protein
MTINQTVSKEIPDPQGIAFWRDNYYCFSDFQPETEEGFSILESWNDFDLYWAYVGPNPFKVGDRIILFNDEATPELPSSVSAITAIEVVDIGPAEIREQYGDLTHFIAYRRLKGFRPVALSLDPILELRSQGIFKSIGDLQHRKKLSQEEWDQIVMTFKLRQAQADPEKQPKGKTRSLPKSDIAKAQPSKLCY